MKNYYFILIIFSFLSCHAQYGYYTPLPDVDVVVNNIYNSVMTDERQMEMAFSNKKYKRAYKYAMKLHNAGKGYGSYILGSMTEYGITVEANRTKALSYYRIGERRGYKSCTTAIKRLKDNKGVFMARKNAWIEKYSNYCHNKLIADGDAARRNIDTYKSDNSNKNSRHNKSKEMCSHCYGRGICNMCNGKGYVSATYTTGNMRCSSCLANYTNDYDDWGVCSYCKGSGKK